MAITFPSTTWITGKNTLILTIPAEIRKRHDITKGDKLIITIQNIYDGHIEYSVDGQFQIVRNETNEIKTE